MIVSEDIMYFLIVIGIFLSLSIVKLYSDKSRNNRKQTILRYSTIFIVASLLAYFSSIPKFIFYYDASQVNANTLTETSQKILEKVEGEVTMTSYVNMADFNYFMAIPVTLNRDKSKFYDLRRFLPRLKMKYVYYYDEPYNNIGYTPGVTSAEDLARQISNAVEIDFDKIHTPKQIKEIIDLEQENNTFVRLVELKNGNKAYLRAFDDLDRYPTESEVSATFLRLTQSVPTVAFSTGNGEPSISKSGENDYSIFAAERQSRMALKFG